MANFNVDVIVDPRRAVAGSRQAIKSLGQVETSANKLRATLQRTFAFASVGLLVAQVVQLTDSYTNLQNRLRVVTNGQSELTAATEELFAISQRTRSSFEGTTELYSRLALAGRDLGVSMRDLTQFTESMNKAIIISGASGREANAGLIQLSQGIASGALRGDELRSVLEQLPVVADVIARQMKVTRGELRALGATGAITAQVILEGFKNAREDLNERFARTIPTISQAFQVLKNSLIKTIGAFNNSNGAAKLLAKTLMLMANNMEFLLRATAALAFTLSVTLAAQAIPKVILGFKALTAAMASNPFGLLAVAITAIIGVLISFGDQIKLEQDRLATFRDVAIVIWERIKVAVAGFVNWFQDNFGFIAEYSQAVFQNMEISMAGFFRYAASGLDQLFGMWLGTYKAILVIWNNFPAAIEAIFRMALNHAISRTETGLNILLNLIKDVLNKLKIVNTISDVAFGRLAESADAGVKATGAALQAAFKEGLDFSFFSNNLESILSDAEKLAAARKKAVVPELSDELLGEAKVRKTLGVTFGDMIALLDQEIALLKLSSKEREIQTGILKIEKKLKRELSAAENEIAESKLREIQALTIQSELYEQIVGPMEEYRDTLENLNVLLQQGKINIAEYNMALQQTQLGGALMGLQIDLALPGEGEMMELQNQLMERNMIIQQAREVNLINEQEALNLSLEANKAYNQAILDIEDARLSGQLRAASQGFAAIANTTRGFVGDQSKAYKALFSISKAFAAADTAVQIANAIGKAANNPWPLNIAAIAQVVSLTAGLISSITNTQYAGGFRTGGDFTVGGSGAPDSQMVSFKATPGEKVSIRTPSQVRDAAAEQKDINKILFAISNEAAIADTNTQYAGGFRTGGDFIVGDSGAPDSRIAPSVETPGERVSRRTLDNVRDSVGEHSYANKALFDISKISTIADTNTQFAGKFQNGGDFTVDKSNTFNIGMPPKTAVPDKQVSMQVPYQIENAAIDPAIINIEAMKQVADIVAGPISSVKNTQNDSPINSVKNIQNNSPISSVTNAQYGDSINSVRNPQYNGSINSIQKTQNAGSVSLIKNAQNAGSISSIQKIQNAGSIKSITNAQYAGGFQTGGDFTVGGSGEPDSQMISFRATPGEQVSVRTPSQVKSEQPTKNDKGVVLEQTIINTIDPDEMFEASSDQTFINKMERNQDSMRNLVRG